MLLPDCNSLLFFEFATGKMIQAISGRTLSTQSDGVYMLRVLLDDAEIIQERLILVK